MAKRNKRNEHKHIVENPKHFKHVKKLVGKGVSITKAVENLCNNSNLKYSDNLRRVFSIALAKSGSTDDKKRIPLEQTGEYNEALNRKVKCSKYYLISTAQAETPVNKKLWENMVAFAEHIGAEILIQPSRYKSPTSLEASKRVKDKEKGHYIWDPTVKDHLYAKDIQLNKYLTVLMSLKIQPTAKMPLSSANGFTGESSAIVPHNKQHLESMPVLPGYKPKLLLTTGAVTKPNFTDTKAGYEGQWAHTYGFVLAEVVDRSKFYVHQISSDDSGEFYFLDYKVSEGKVEKGNVKYPAITFGDIHYGETDAKAYAASIVMAKRLGVENVFLHDVANFHSISHHDMKSPLRMLYKEEHGLDDLEAEIRLVLAKLTELDKYLPDTTLHVVESNHPLWLERWLDSTDWRKVNNKRLYIEFANLVASGDTEGLGVMNYLITKKIPNIKAYTEDDSLRIRGYEMLIHGHIGAAASRGSINQFKNLSTKTITAHSHVPRRYNGALSAGTLTILRPDYVRGLSAWMHSNVVVAPNGRATHIHILEGSYTTL